MNVALERFKNSYLVGVSGGPDSMALCSMLIEHHISIHIAHVNYHHRVESDQEQLLVESFAKKHHIPVHIYHAYENNKGNFEDWARRIRYQFFADLCKEYQLDGCFIAHQKDDLLETYLMQKNRGMVTYYGLKEQTLIKGTKIYRPLLSYTKKELEEYCVAHKVPYALDQSNFDTTYTRNAIRKMLNKASIDEKNSLLTEMESNNKELEEMDAAIAKIDKKDIPFHLVKEMNPRLRQRFFYQWIHSETGIESISKKRIDDIYTQLTHSQGNKVISLSKKYNLYKEYDCLNIVKIKKYNYHIIVMEPSIIENEWIYFDLKSAPNLFYIHEDSFPLTIEIATKADKISINGMKKSVNRLWIEQKIPLQKRLYWPKIVNNKGQIIFIPRKSESDYGLYVVK